VAVLGDPQGRGPGAVAVGLTVRDGIDLTLTLPVPRIIDGKYRLDRLIGRGGMGAVYEARDLRLGRDVAVKVMIGGQFGREAALRRFRREARAVARLNHPNIVALHDFGELEGGGAYLVMERIHGASLRAELRRAGSFKPADAAEWFDQVLDGLNAAHEHGVVSGRREGVGQRGQCGGDRDVRAVGHGQSVPEVAK